MITMELTEWQKQGKDLFGEEAKNWRFKCVKCGHIQTAKDFKDIGMNPESYVHFSCIGRWKEGVGCDWTLGGLFTIHKKEVIVEDGKKIPVFMFDGEPEPEKGGV
jgi:hypothetical protein